MGRSPLVEMIGCVLGGSLMISALQGRSLARDAFHLGRLLLGSAEGGSPVSRGKRDDPTQDHFRSTKVPVGIDAIVVGSGIGGLVCAAALAKLGRRVVVLEQHYRAGGCCHAFDEYNETFDSGIHYVGSCAWHMKLLAPLLGLARMREYQMEPIGTKANGFAYDHFDLGTELFTYRKGQKALEEELTRRFPDEATSILNYIRRTVPNVTHSSELFFAARCAPFQWLGRLLGAPIRYFGGQTVDAFLKPRFKSPELRALLGAGQMADWNGIPDESAFWCTAMMMQYYINGAHYPTGGTEHFSRLFIEAIERSGGRVLTKASVARILSDEHGVLGVELTTGSKVHARTVISDANPMVTHGLLSEEDRLKWRLPECPVTVDQGRPHMTCFVSVEGTPEELEIDGANIHSMPGLPRFDFDVSRLQRSCYADYRSHAHHSNMFITSPAGKDSKYQSRYPGHSNFVCLAEAHWDWMKPFHAELAGVKSGERERHSPAYADFKRFWEAVFKERILKYYPKVDGRISSIFVGTPLTTEHYLNAPKGTSYGMEWTPERFTSLAHSVFTQPSLPMTGLYQTGQDVFLGSYVGAIHSGWITTLHVLGLPCHLRSLLLSCGLVLGLKIACGWDKVCREATAVAFSLVPRLSRARR